MISALTQFSSDEGPAKQRSWLDRLEWLVAFIGVMGFSNLFAMILVGLPRDPDTDLSQITGPARMSWYPIYLSILLISLVRWRNIVSALPRAWPLAALFALTVASLQWSIAPDMTMRRCIALFFTVHFGFYLAVRAPFVDTLRLIGWVWLCLTVLTLCFVFALPHVGVDHRTHIGAWTGFLGTKNLMGGELSRAHTIFFALAFLDRRWRQIWLVGMALSLTCVLGSTSKTALLALAAPYAVFIVYLLSRQSVLMALFSIWGVVTSLGITYFVLANYSAQLVKLIGKDLTFSGRTDIWDACFELINRHPWTGFGYAAFWRTEEGPVAEVLEKLQWEAPTAHNSWVEVTLSLGYPGMALIIGMTILAGLRSLALMSGRHGPVMAMMLLQLVLVSLSESLLWEQNMHATLLFSFVVTTCLVPRRIPLPQVSRQPRMTPDYDLLLPERVLR